MSRMSILGEITAERNAQDSKWGQQNHPDGTGPFMGISLPPSQPTTSLMDRSHYTYTWLSHYFRQRCNRLHDEGDGTWEQILSEEIYEAYAESDPVKLRTELVQSAAVIVAWIEAIDRRSRPRPMPHYVSRARLAHPEGSSMELAAHDHIHSLPDGECIQNRHGQRCANPPKETTSA